MELAEANEIATRFLAFHECRHTGLVRAQFRAKGTVLGGEFTITDDEWSLCFAREMEEGELSSNMAIIVIVDVASRTARFLG